MNGAGLYERIKSDLSLPPDFREVLEQPLTALGYNIVSHDDVLDFMDVPLSHNCAQANGRNVALLHLSKEILSSDDTMSHVVQLGMQFSKKVASLFFFTQSTDFSELRYNQIIAKKLKSNAPGLCEAAFFRYEVIEHLKGLTPEGRKNFLSDLLALSRLQASAPPPAAPPPGGGVTNNSPVEDEEAEPEVKKAMLDQQYINALVRIMERKAVSVPNITPAQYLRNVVEGAVIPTALKNSMLNLTGNAKIDAQNILKAANSQNRNVADDKSTVIGSLLQPLLTPEEIDPDDQRTVAGVIYYNRLLLEDDDLRALALRFQIPDPAPAATPDTPPRGPAFTPHLPGDTKVLQGFFSRKPPDMQDVGTMKLALKRTSAVCRVEIPGGRFGTGFLIAPGLVLTNYHVLNLEGLETEEQTLENALQAKLRFGFISAERGREEKGQVFKLDRQSPILEWSPIPQLDFALLRVEEAVLEAQDIEPVEYSLDEPTPNATLNMIQHPEGQVMKIALSGNAVTWLSDDKRLIQYVTPAAAGSSGSPCFNDEWNVVAIHHAEETRRFAGIIDAGTVREGILFSEIYKQIKGRLR